MFGGSRRHRQASQPLTSATANPNAATAAASAFARRTSSPSLSSAAAAAALRSRPTTPVNVADVQTKRTQKRSASVSSHGSQDTRRGLQRSPSQSSMAERTFRSPSPHRAVATPENAPPVPTIPSSMRSTTGKNPHTRATSLQMQPFRVASQKTKDGSGSWFGAAAEGNMANVRTSDTAMRAASPESRPGARLASPRRTESVASRSTTNSVQSLVYDPNSRRMVPRTDLLEKEQIVRDASEKPVKKRKPQQGLARSGSHLAKGTVGRVQGSAIAAAEEAVFKRQEQPQVQIPTGAPEQKTWQNQSPANEAAEPVPVMSQRMEPAPTNAKDPSPTPIEATQQHTTVDIEPTHQQPVRQPEPEQPTVQEARKSDGATGLPRSELRQGAPTLGRKPSIVQEESDDELEDSDEEADVIRQPAAHQNVADVHDVVPMKSSVPAQQPSLSSESTAVESPVILSSQRQPSPPQQKQYNSVRHARAHSSSPARSAHFALGTDSLAIRHEPPPRSVSPRKSAMKYSTSPSRGASPSEEGSEASGPSRFGSEATAVEAAMPHKRSVRVSFDDENTKIVGQSTAKPEVDSPAPPSPQQAKRHWYNHLGRNRKKDFVSLDEDEVMKPRPALPSFGSVREKKPREPEERPLVRPLESPPPPGPDTLDRIDEHLTPIEQSSDHNVGAILNQEQTARNAANISRFREPLPPVVTSMEGSGYYSASSTTSSEDEGDEGEAEVFQDPEGVQEPEPTLPPGQIKEEILAAHPELVGDAPVPADNKTRHGTEEFVPSISVIQPTPTPKEMVGTDSSSPSRPGYFDVPGGFPKDESDDNVHSRGPQTTQTAKLDGAAKSVAKAELHPIPVEESESEGDSIYSDAYEDLSDVDGDGFMSLDAVVASPIPEKASKKHYQKAPATSPQETTSKSGTINNHTAPEISHLSGDQQPEDEWEKAKLYWRGLTSDKRRQLESEALEEAGAEGDLEEAIQPKKFKRKKSVRKSDPATQQQTPANPERTYQIQPGTKAIDEEDEEELPTANRKSLRGRQGQETGPANGKLKKTMSGAQPQSLAATGMGMRKTLRTESSVAQASQQPQPASSGGMRKSMRQNDSSQRGIATQERANATAGQRPLSLQGPSSRDALDTRSRCISTDNPMSSVELAKAMQSNLRRRGSDSSESSFKRARPNREGLGFRKSMRAGAEADPSAAGRNSRFSLRSMSPPASPQSPPISMGNRTTIRSTLRSDSSDGSARRMRLPTFGMSSAKKVAGKSTNKSRFGESSDEEDAGQSGFRSRFADSSDDDEEPAGLSASQNMPKSMRASSSAAAAAMKVPPPRYNEKEDEADLPDSSEEEAATSPQQKPLSPRRVSGSSGRLVKSQSNGYGLQRSGSGRGALVGSSTTSAVGTQAMVRPNHQRKGSFLSALRRKKDDDAGKISRPSAGESAARTDTKLERSHSELSTLRGATTSSKLQKQPVDNWPLVEETIDDEKRPMTADNSRAMDASRPVFMKRRSTNQVLTSGHTEEYEGSVQVDSSGKKKKKFGTLRRMFKLDD